ncbi:MAG: DUF1559 domain-containing protein [Pirellulales bacterium]|nr:DUF1559 domain-containing protein [Pirellulales bacterium]
MRASWVVILLIAVFVAAGMITLGWIGLLLSLCPVILVLAYWMERNHGCAATLAVFMLFMALGLFLIGTPEEHRRALEAARRMQCAWNLKRIAVALHEYHTEHGSFPPAVVVDGQGRPMHGWRRLVAPYIGEAMHPRPYDLKQPWDAPDNASLDWVGEMPEFQCPSGPKTPGMTNYVAVVGPGTVWQGTRGVSLDEFTDDPAKTILLVELADSDIPWPEPRDITLDEALGLPDAPTGAVPSSRHTSSQDFLHHPLRLAGNVVMADGTVLSIESLSRDELLALLTINGGEPIPDDILTRRAARPAPGTLNHRTAIGLPVWALAFLLLISHTVWSKRRRAQSGND